MQRITETIQGRTYHIEVSRIASDRLARAPRAPARAAERDDAVLRRDAGKRCADARRVAGTCAGQRAGVIAPTPARGRPRAIACALLVSTLLASSTLPAAAADRPARVRVIATGGTIANAPTGRLTGEQLVASLAHPERLGRLEAETFAERTRAPALTLDDCARLSRHLIAVLAADADLDGVVVTSGTDTLEELAWFLYLTVPGDRPIVVVGAMRRPGSRDSDGPANLADAVRVPAASRRADAAPWS